MAMSRTKPRRSRSDHTAHAKLIGADLLEEPHRAADSASTVMRVASLVGDKIVEAEGADQLAATLARPDATTWIDLTGATAAEVEAITTVDGLHPLIAEDILEGNQRAKIEVTDDLIHIVLFAFEYTDHAERTEIDIVLGKGFLLTVHGPEWDPRT
jgi:Mg2+ and Co2+ transporter CorA